jgi:hypothetical protein
LECILLKTVLTKVQKRFVSIVWGASSLFVFHSLSIYTGEKHCFLLLRNTLYKRIKALAL